MTSWGHKIVPTLAPLNESTLRRHIVRAEQSTLQLLNSNQEVSDHLDTVLDLGSPAQPEALSAIGLTKESFFAGKFDIFCLYVQQCSLLFFSPQVS